MPDKIPDPPLTLADLDGRLFCTVPEAASVVGCHPDTLRQDIRAGRVPYLQTGSRYKVPVAWLRAKAAEGAAA